MGLLYKNRVTAEEANLNCPIHNSNDTSPQQTDTLTMKPNQIIDFRNLWKRSSYPPQP
jgi:hypothetical protein